MYESEVFTQVVEYRFLLELGENSLTQIGWSNDTTFARSGKSIIPKTSRSWQVRETPFHARIGSNKHKNWKAPWRPKSRLEVSGQPRPIHYSTNGSFLVTHGEHHFRNISTGPPGGQKSKPDASGWPGLIHYLLHKELKPSIWPFKAQIYWPLTARSSMVV